MTLPRLAVQLPNFWTGLRSAVDLFAVGARVDSLVLTGPAADSFATALDWEAVGNDLRFAVREEERAQATTAREQLTLL